jgi:hypothetical protein
VFVKERETKKEEEERLEEIVEKGNEGAKLN